MPTLEDLKKFSVSENIYRQVVVPLYNSGNVKNLDGLLDLLKKIHSSLWAKGGYPAGFSGAVAGNFQEILDGYFTAVVAGHKVQYGSINDKGGDTVREVVVGEGLQLAVETTQFKVTAAHAGEVRHHICKAVWQLTGAGGELPEPGSTRVVEVVVQDESMIEPGESKPLGAFTSDDWKTEIITALEEGYSAQNPAKTKQELYAAVEYIYITTVRERFKFLVLGDQVLFMGSGFPTRHKYMFKESTFERHWLWLTNDYWSTIKWSGYDYAKVQKQGIGAGTGTPDELPKQPKPL